MILACHNRQLLALGFSMPLELGVLQIFHASVSWAACTYLTLRFTYTFPCSYLVDAGALECILAWKAGLKHHALADKVPSSKQWACSAGDSEH